MTPNIDPDAPPRLPAPPTAADVCTRFKLSPAGRGCLEPDATPRQAFDRLVEAGHLADARRLLAFSLRPTAAVWWSSLCLQHSQGEKPFDTPAETEAFVAVGRWLVGPTEANRRAAAEAGRAAGSTGAGVLAAAVFLSGGSISRPGLPAVIPGPYLCGRLCGVVVYLASVRFDPARYKDHLRAYLSVGRDVARGVNPPPTLTPSPLVVEPSPGSIPIGWGALSEADRGPFRAGPVALELPADERAFLADPAGLAEPNS